MNKDMVTSIDSVQSKTECLGARGRKPKLPAKIRQVGLAEREAKTGFLFGFTRP
uniref:Uncharacterized protein n=1 Tax=Candidatus Kentrum sp. LFY TaxID=2126342 RepID=A0A450WTF4_9GAMM|nr:MAG: hypothetical protein BECKLFY1418C_GA0070996_10707 [Candidatus Kentron sp. LFY]